MEEVQEWSHRSCYRACLRYIGKVVGGEECYSKKCCRLDLRYLGKAVWGPGREERGAEGWTWGYWQSCAGEVVWCYLHHTCTWHVYSQSLIFLSTASTSAHPAQSAGDRAPRSNFKLQDVCMRLQNYLLVVAKCPDQRTK